jgi:hypothetical protein
MKRKSHPRTRRTTTKSVLRLPDLEHPKAAVLNSMTCPDAQRGYRHAIDEFVDWYCSEPRLAFNRIVVLRYRSHLERARPLICLDTYMLCGVYEGSGICFRNHCGAEPPRDIGPAGLVTTVGGRDRASAWYAAADGVKAPASAARGRFRGIHGGRTAPSVPAET